MDIEGFGDDLLTLTRQRFVWLWCWLGVLVVGCSGNGSSGGSAVLILTPTPRLATLTLLGWTLTPMNVTTTAVPHLLRTPSAPPSYTTLTMVPTILPSLAALRTEAPSCYDTATGSVYCLGVVKNTLLFAVERLMVRVYLVDAAGTALAQGESALAQFLLLPGERAPYGVLFDSAPAGIVGGVAVLLHAAEVSDPSVVRLTVEETVQDGFRVTGIVVNTSTRHVSRPCVIVTLYDEAGAVTGFRIWRPAEALTLEGGASLVFDVVAVPQGKPAAQIEISAEGFVAVNDAPG